MSSKAKANDLFSSSDSDGDLDHELAAAAALERKKNPHALEGRAKHQRLPHELRAPAPASKHHDLFGSDSDASSGEDEREAHDGSDVSGGDDEDGNKQPKGKSSKKDTGLQVNKQYAARFEEIKRKQELHKLTEKYGKKLASLKVHSDEDDSGSDDSSEEEDDDAVLITEENDLAFAKALLAVKTASSKAKKINAVVRQGTADTAKLREEEAYLQQRYFPPAEEQIQANTEVFQRALEKKREEKQKGKKKFTLSDEYKRTVEASAAGDNEEEEEGLKDSSGLRKLKPQNAEERALRASFLKNVEESTEAFSVSKKSNPNVGSTAEGSATGDGRNAKLLEERNRLLSEAFALKPEEDEEAGSDDNNNNGNDEAFIRDFFSKELWRGNDDDNEDDDEEGDANKSYAKKLAELAQAEEDEAFFRDVDAWERDYQEKKYRHEEEAESASHVQTFPRNIGEDAAGLLRKQNTARKDARKRRQERMDEIRATQLEELKRLKHLKRQEIDEQRALIASVAGLTTGRSNQRQKSSVEKPQFSDEDEALEKLKSVWTESDLNAPYDPAEFDKKMSQLFDDNYYKEGNVDEQEIAYFEAELDNEENDGEGIHEDESDDDEDPTSTYSDSKKKKKKASRFLEVAEEPELFNMESLEEAKEHISSSTKKGNDMEDIFADPFGAEDDNNNSSNSPNTNDDVDAMALLYPSAALRHLEESTFQKKQQLDALLTAATQNNNKRSAKDGDHSDIIEKLKTDLKQKEEEYDKLHHDDTIAGGEIKTRFRYREVPADDFTLSIEEILARDDRQLNMIAPMNCYAAYLDKTSNMRDRRKIEERRRKGFRELDADRTSRRYKNVASTALFDENMDEAEGVELAKQIRKRLRDDAGTGGDDENSVEKDVGAVRSQQTRRIDGSGQGYRGRGAGAGAAPSGRGGFSRGRGGERGGRGGGDHRGRGGFGRGGFGRGAGPVGSAAGGGGASRGGTWQPRGGRPQRGGRQ